MRIVFQNETVFAGARFAFVAVDQDELRLGRVFRNKGPLHSCREACAATPAEIGSLDFIDDLVRLHFQRLAHSLVTIKFDMTVDVCSAFAKALGNNSNLVGMGG